MVIICNSHKVISRLAVPSTDLVVDLSNNGSAENGTPVVVSRRRDEKHQVWKLVQGKNDAFISHRGTQNLMHI